VGVKGFFPEPEEREPPQEEEVKNEKTI